MVGLDLGINTVCGGGSGAGEFEVEVTTPDKELRFEIALKFEIAVARFADDGGGRLKFGAITVLVAGGGAIDLVFVCVAVRVAGGNRVVVVFDVTGAGS